MSLDIWKALAGIAIFLLGMNFLEDGLTHLAGRPFKLFLKRQTTSNLRAVIGGTLVTGLLQSSSIVNLMVLAFVGAGIIRMQNALGLILGANLGSTFTSWIIVIFGFSFNLEDLALPITAVSGIALALVAKESRLSYWCKFLLGFGFLFIGLGFIKTGIENSLQHLDLKLLNDQPGIVFLLIGFVVTAIIQSSAAMMAIALSALHSNAISFYSATAIVLGAEAGTAIKLIIASIKGVPAKKRVAVGNLLFNVISTIIIFIVLKPVNSLITDKLAIQDNLVALAFFQSFVNLAGIIAFFPFLGIIGRFLEKRFKQRSTEGLFLSKAPIEDPQLALTALENETANFISHVLVFAANSFNTSYRTSTSLRHRSFDKMSPLEKYEYIKILHGDIQRFAIGLMNLQHEDRRADQLLSAVRNGMYAAKNIRDAMHDIEQLRNSSNDAKYSFYKKNRDKLIAFFARTQEIMDGRNSLNSFDVVTQLYREIQTGYTQSLKELYDEAWMKNVNHSEVSTLINFNREIYTAFKSLVFSLKDYVLEEKDAIRFDDLPGFIR